MRWVWLVLGILAIVVGSVWTLQGLNIMSGGAMSGHGIFVVIGLIVGVIVAYLVVFCARGRAARA
jgi:hypothetical protein